MSKYVFMFKENETNDRDCVKYIDIERLGKLECGHYFPSINLEGACFSEGFKVDKVDFNNITSILSKDDFIALRKYNNAINELGYGIKQGDNRYKKGIQLYEEIKPVLNKLLSKENEVLYSQIIKEEIKYLKNEHNLNDSDIEKIFENYNLNYRDRAIIGAVFDDIEDCAREEAESMGYINENNNRYFNYETFGEDLLESENYLKLDDGRVIYYMY